MTRKSLAWFFSVWLSVPLYGMSFSKKNKEEKKVIQLQKAQQSNGSIFEFQEDEETGDSLEQVTVPQFEENVTESESTKEPEKKKVVRESLF